jgi:hypothetical protein
MHCQRDTQHIIPNQGTEEVLEWGCFCWLRGKGRSFAHHPRGAKNVKQPGWAKHKQQTGEHAMLFWKSVCPIYCLFKAEGQGRVAGPGGQGGLVGRQAGQWVADRPVGGGWAGWGVGRLGSGQVGWTEAVRLAHQSSSILSLWSLSALSSQPSSL